MSTYFTQNKFLSLPLKSRYKKISNQLRNIVLYCPKDWKKDIEHYNEMVMWVDENNKKLDQNYINTQKIMEYYLFWTNKAGLGVESRLYNKFSFNDLQVKRAFPIDWSILLHNIRSGYNVGAAIRTADCFGLSEIHTSGFTADNKNNALKSAALGADRWMPLKKWESPFDCLKSLDKKCTIIALETNSKGTNINKFKWPEKGIIIVGNEEFGIPDELIAKADYTIWIEMFGRKSSLNVSNALSIALFQLRNSYNFLKK